jgi:xylulose-5-phosphate/fructose-6-phosphate phosphoketolase
LLAGKKKMAIREKLIAHKTYIQQYGEDMPEIRNWQWGEWQ